MAQGAIFLTIEKKCLIRKIVSNFLAALIDTVDRSENKEGEATLANISCQWHFYGGDLGEGSSLHRHIPHSFSQNLQPLSERQQAEGLLLYPLHTRYTSVELLRVASGRC